MGLREEFQAAIDGAQEELDRVVHQMRWLDARPKGCVCDPRDWCGPPGEICNNFEPFKDDPSLCRNCEHEERCHAAKKED